MSREATTESRAVLPQALRALAALLRAGLPFGAAVAAWPDQCPPELRAAAARAAARVALGDRPACALAALTAELGDAAGTVAAIAELHETSGCDAARLLEAAARSIERREVMARAASISTSGAKLSGRIVGALPLVVLPLMPAAGTPLFDRRGSLMLLIGGALLFAGAWWIARLLPRAPEGDAVGELASFVAAVVASGVALAPAIAVGVRAADRRLAQDLRVCARRVRLGLSWPAALTLAPDEGLESMGRALMRSERMGAPVAGSLEAFARSRADAAEATFDRATRRAPVLMVLPLTICILPAYVVLAIGPLLRGLSFG